MARILSDWTDETPWLPRVHAPAEDLGNILLLLEKTGLTVACRRRLLRPAVPLGFLARRGSFVHGLYVAGGARGRGIGSALIRHAQQQAPRLELWCFAANTRALAFYARMGFSVTGSGEGGGNDEGLPELRLEWSPE